MTPTLTMAKSNQCRTLTQLCIEVGRMKYSIFLTDDQLQHISNRMQSFAKGGDGFEVLAEEIEV